MGGTGIFEFQTMAQTALGGMGGKMIPAIVTVAYVLMAIALLLAIYEAFAKGGDTRQLVAALFKYIVVAFIIGNWSTFFSDLMTGFNSIAQYIVGSYGATDLMKDWGTQLSNNWSNNGGFQAIWNMVTSGPAAIFNALEVAIAYILFPLAVQIFTLIYVFWGAVLYAIGPLVLALGPSQMINSTAKFYARNLVVWNCWAIVYAVFTALISAVNGQTVATSPFFNGGVAGSEPQLFIGLTSILYSICILLIPVVAFSVLKGEYGPVGSAMMGLVSTASQLTRTAAAVSKRSGGGGGGSFIGSSSTPNGTRSNMAYSNMSIPPAPTPSRTP